MLELLAFLIRAPSLCQSPGRPRFIFYVVAHFELCFLHSVSSFFVPSEAFLNNIVFLYHGPSLCLHLEILAPFVPAPHTFRSCFERTAESKNCRSASGAERSVLFPSTWLCIYAVGLCSAALLDGCCCCWVMRSSRMRSNVRRMTQVQARSTQARTTWNVDVGWNCRHIWSSR